MKRRNLAWLWAAVCSLLIFAGGHAQAQDKKRVVVLEFEGRGAASVRGHVLDALKQQSEVEVVSGKEAEAARKKLRVSWGEADAYQRVGAKLGVSAFVEGDVAKAGPKMRARIRVRDASTGSVSHEEPWTRKKLPQLKAVEENFWKVMGPHIMASSVPAGAESAPAEVDEPEPEPPPPPPAAEEEAEPVAETLVREEELEPEVPKEPGKGGPALIVWAGPRLMWRTLNYEEATTLSSYKNEAGSPAVNAALGVSWFPGAHFRSDWVADFGIEGDLDYSIGLKSKLAGKEHSTTAYEFGIGALYRLPLDSFEPRFRVGYVMQKFDADVPAGTPLPAVDYSSLRLGLGTGIHLVEWLGLDVSAAYLHVLSAGEIASNAYASKLSARAFEFGGALITHFKEVFGVRLAVDFRRYKLDFGGSTNATHVLPKSGADHYLRTTLAFVYELPGG